MKFDEIRWVASDGLDLYCRRYGGAQNGHVLLCLPGLTRNCKDFETLALRLRDRWQVLTPDLRGRGQSARDPQPGRYALPTHVRDCTELLEILGIGQVAVIGTSLGGLAGMKLTAETPARVRGLVLNDIGPEIPAAAVRRIAAYAGRGGPVADWESAVRQVRAQYGSAFIGVPDSFWDAFTRLSWHENESGVPVQEMDPAVISSLKKQFLRDRALNVLRALLLRPRKALPFDAWDSFAKIDTPLVLIRGAVSDVTPPPLVERMLREQHGMDVVNVPDRGHAPTLDEPVAVEALDRFLSRLE